MRPSKLSSSMRSSRLFSATTTVTTTATLAVLSALLVLLFASTPANALHFYLTGAESKCFLEDMIKGATMSGTYFAEEWSEPEKKYFINPSVGLQISVLEIPTNSMLVNTRGKHEGSFHFAALEPGQHKICLQANSTAWFNAPSFRVRLTTTYSTVHDDTKENSGKVDAMGKRIGELNRKIEEIKNEQREQRLMEFKFRRLSEKINKRIVWWTFTQIVVIGIVCFLQLFLSSHSSNTEGIQELSGGGWVDWAEEKRQVTPVRTKTNCLR
ncbi:hypothetical protein GQ42DRAFT_155955 [Ramicandelaber brevisporus]|nr:hypothetical protein GQ42DRAFT_155955 [Ramicandelaber brevisporus]